MTQRLFKDKDRLDVATNLNNLGMLYQAQGRLADAEPLLKNALEMSRRLFKDKDHPSVAINLSHLAFLYQHQGKYGEAESLAKDALTMSLRLSAQSGSLTYGNSGSVSYQVQVTASGALSTTLVTSSLSAGVTASSPGLTFTTAGTQTVTLTLTTTAAAAATINNQGVVTPDLFTVKADNKSATGSITINPRAVAVAADSLTKQYGSGDPALTYQITSGSLVNGNTFSGSLTRASGENVGNYAITQGNLSLGKNYTLAFTGANLKIDPRPLSFTVGNVTKPYGTVADFSSLPATVSTGIGNEKLAVAYTSLGAPAGASVADSPYAISATFSNTNSGTASNYDVTFSPGQLTVTKATPTITWSKPANITYGTPLSATQLSAVASTTGTFAYDPGAGAVLHFGSNQPLSVLFTPDDTTDYTTATKTVNITVGKAPLTVTVNPTVTTYGTAPTFSVSYDGFVNGDGSASLGGALTFSGAATNAGTYTITATGLTSSDYAITFVSGQLTVDPKALTVNIIGKPTRTYDATTVAALTADNFSILGLIGMDSFTVTKMTGEYNRPNVAEADMVTAMLVPGDFVAGPNTLATNYTFPTSASGAGYITKAGSTTAVVWADGASATYNGIAHTAAASWSSTSTDHEGGSLSVTYEKLVGATWIPIGSAPVDAGTYRAKATFDGDDNHTGSMSPADFTINKADAAISVSGFSGTYDGHFHPAMGSATGVESPTPVDLSAGLTFYYSKDGGATFTTTAPKNAGTYTVFYTYTDSTGNYNDVAAKTDSGQVVAIAKAGSTTAVVWADGASATYNGIAHTAAASWSSTSTDHEGGSLSVTYEKLVGATWIPIGSAPVDAGTYRAKATFDGDDSHTGSSDSKMFVINKAVLTGDATTQGSLNLAKQGLLTITIGSVQGLQGGDTLTTFLSTAHFYITVNGVRYEFAPTIVTTASGGLTITYSLKSPNQLTTLTAALGSLGATSGATAVTAGFAIESQNYMFGDSFLTRIFSTAV